MSSGFKYFNVDHGLKASPVISKYCLSLIFFAIPSVCNQCARAYSVFSFMPLQYHHPLLYLNSFRPHSCIVSTIVKTWLQSLCPQYGIYRITRRVQGWTCYIIPSSSIVDLSLYTMCEDKYKYNGRIQAEPKCCD